MAHVRSFDYYEGLEPMDRSCYEGLTNDDLVQKIQQPKRKN